LVSDCKSCFQNTMSTGSSPGVKRPGRRVDHTPPPSAEIKERVELYLYSTSGPSWPVKGSTLPLPFLLLFYCRDSFFTVPIVILMTRSLFILLDFWTTECPLYLRLGRHQRRSGRFWGTHHLLNITYEILTLRQ